MQMTARTANRQQRWIQQEAANPQQGRFTTETTLDRVHADLKFSTSNEK